MTHEQHLRGEERPAVVPAEIVDVARVRDDEHIEIPAGHLRTHASQPRLELPAVERNDIGAHLGGFRSCDAKLRVLHFSCICDPLTRSFPLPFILPWSSKKTSLSRTNTTDVHPVRSVARTNAGCVQSLSPVTCHRPSVTLTSTSL